MRTASFLHEDEVLPLALEREAHGRRRRELERAVGLALSEEGGLSGLSELYLVLLAHKILLPAAARMAKHDLDTHTYRLFSSTLLPRLGMPSFERLIGRLARMQRASAAPPRAEHAGAR